jgi:3',5'-cyclic AMP phosphodiesterase CpdA
MKAKAFERGIKVHLDKLQSSSAVNPADQELLYFWALGDLHYCAIDAWQAIHTRRLTPMFRDLRSLWSREGYPAFCVSPGDIIEKSAPENFELAKKELENYLGKVPFYPGLGNHELYADSDESIENLIQDYTIFWGKPVRYFWVENGVLCIMLDAVGYPEPFYTQETLSFLETALAKHPRQPAVIFSHCSLYNTVLDRAGGSGNQLDYHTLDPFFAIQNSKQVRAILARHRNAGLYLSGHTHSGWQAPNLVYTEQLGDHSVTFLNVMSPWYTGFHKGPRLSSDHTHCDYTPDAPDVLVSFSIQVYRDKALIRLRDHRGRSWRAEWVVPIG